MKPVPELAAKRGSRCKLCREKIRRGDYISPVGDGWAHALCAAGYRRLLAEQDEEAA